MTTRGGAADGNDVIRGEKVELGNAVGAAVEVKKAEVLDKEIGKEDRGDVEVVKLGLKAVEVTAADVDGAAVVAGVAVVASGEVDGGAEVETGGAAAVEVCGEAVEVTAADVDGAAVVAGVAVVASGEVDGGAEVETVALKMSTTSV